MKKILTAITVLVFIFSQNLLAQGWQWLDTGFPFIIFDMSFPSGQSDIGFAVGSNLTFGGDGIILKTTDGGSNWSKISTDTIPGLKAVSFTSADVGYAAGHQNFLMKTTDGGSTWTLIIIDPKLWYFNNIEFYDANNGIAVSYPFNVYATTDAGTTWVPAIGIKREVQDICYADENTAFMVGSAETISKSTDGGLTWLDNYSGVVQAEFLGVEFYDANYGIVTGEDGKVLVTTNGGADWMVHYTGGSGLMRGIHIFNEQNSYVVGTPEQVFKTTNGGFSWFSDFNGANTVALYKIIFTENNTGLICGSQGKFLINTDFVPVELTSFTAGLFGEAIIINWTTATETNNSGFEIQKQAGSMQSTTGNWETIGFVPGFGTTTEPKLYKFTDEEVTTGIYKYRLKQIDFDGSFEYSDIVNVFVSFPIGYNLEQNYPNPFNPSTTIQYELPVYTNVQLKIYDKLGNEVRALVNESQQPGKKIYQWDGKDDSGRVVSSGVYFYQLRTKEFLQTKKLMLLK